MLSFLKLFNGIKLIGDPKSFSLEERIFNTFCIIAFVTMCFEVPFNLAIGLMVPTILCTCGVVISGSLYYLSRFKRKSTLGIILFSIACNITFSINYFYNSGSYGPSLLLFSLAFLLVVAIIPKEQFKIWIPINLALVLSLLTIEYFYPKVAPNVYGDNVSRSIDFAISYLVIVILTYFAISYIRKNYDYERILAINKSKAIEDQKGELERINSEKDKLFSIVTHDLRMPLNSIQGYLELLTEVDLDDMERQQIKKQLLQITRDTSDMLTNVLSWSKTQLEGSYVELKSFNVSSVMLKGLNIEKNIALKKGVEFIVECDDSLNIIADENMFQIVLRNLVNNALKFTSAQGLVKLIISKEGEDCLIKVRDNGLGIDKKQQLELFKLNASSTFGTNNERGIGLGLLLCKQFTDLQGGKIWFESTLEKGSTFFLSFKLANELVMQ